MPLRSAVELQRDYYARTAHLYDDAHVAEDGEHGLAIAFMLAMAGHFGFRSILDVGSGTGRALLSIKQNLPDVHAVGVEPSAELRNIGHGKGLSSAELIDGDATRLDFADCSFDLVCEYGALHHIARPAAAVSEMLRVARRAIFISDSNNFGQGSLPSRLLKQGINALRGWPLANYLKTRGKGYTLSDGDGLAYSYSIFNDFALIKSKCASVHLLNTSDAGPNLYRSAPHAALLGLKGM